jgi:hypothetical protein
MANSVVEEVLPLFGIWLFRRRGCDLCSVWQELFGGRRHQQVRVLTSSLYIKGEDFPLRLSSSTNLASTDRQSLEIDRIDDWLM